MPRTKKEARAFQRLGIIPTHVFQIIMSNDSGKVYIRFYLFYLPLIIDFFFFFPDKKEITKTISNDYFCNNDIHNNINNVEMQKYKKNLPGLREAYANYLIVN